jgi:hypothetical protein
VAPDEEAAGTSGEEVRVVEVHPLSTRASRAKAATGATGRDPPARTERERSDVGVMDG